MSNAHAPHRIASLQPSATSILGAINELDHLVACTKYCIEVCPELATRKLAIVKDSWTSTADEILATHPDLVIAAVPYQEKALGEILKAGVRFLGLAPKNLNDIYTDIATISGILGASDRGSALIAKMMAEIDVVRQRTTNCIRPKVFCEEWGKPLIASQPWVEELIDAAGGEFVGEPGAQRDPRAVELEDPDILVAAWCGAGDRVPLEKIVRERGWEEMIAVQQGRVYCIRDEFLNTPGPTLLQGLSALASAIHPELFPQALGLRCIDTARGQVRGNSVRKVK